MSDYSPPEFDSPNFNTSLFLTNDGGYLTLLEGDNRYLRLSGGTVKGLTTFNSGINSTSYSLNGSPINFSAITGVSAGTATANKALILDGAKEISTLNAITSNTYYGTTANIQLMNTDILSSVINVNVLRSTNGECFIADNGIVRSAIHCLTSSCHIGTTTNHTFNLQANAANVLQCLNTGNVNIVNSLQVAGAGISIGNNVSSISSDIVIMENASTPQIEIGRAQTNGNSFNIGYTHIGDGNVLNRLFIQPRGASTNDTLTYTVNGGRIGIGSPTPTQKLEVNGNINVSSGNGFMIGGTSIDTRYLRTDADSTNTAGLRLYSTAAVGGVQTILRMGHTVASGDWYFRHYRDTTAANNTLEFLNTNSTLLGLSIGTFNGTSDGDGCMMVMNGIQGTGAWIGANQAATNGALHINAGIPQAVPANWNYSPTGSGSAAGGTVSISLYCYNNIWVRGSMYASSDLRLKTNIQPVEEKQAMRLLNIKPVWYNWIKEEKSPQQLGFIAQDLIRGGLRELTMAFKNEDMGEDKELEIPAGKQLSVSYDRIPLYLLEICKNLNNRLKDIEADNVLSKKRILALEKIIEEYDIVE